ncbi:unnamed protein product, partial [Discosporangium mesarthrocarpum]
MCSDPPWSGRMFHTVVTVNSAMYLIGGFDGRRKLNDVWASTDGWHWSLVTHEAQWSPRSGHAAVALERGLYVIGGEGEGDGEKLNDVWRSLDGAHWTREENVPFSPRQGHAAVSHQGYLVVLGGVKG